MADNESPLSECWQKLGRGEEHLTTLDREIREFLEKKPYTVKREYDSEQFRYLFRLNIHQPIPEQWALIIGDCVHAGRSALDYLAWRLAGADLSDRDTLFPIFLTECGFEKGLRRLSRIDAGAIAEFRKLQPYRQENPNRSILWTLQELDARDKHKLLTPTQILSDLTAFTFDQPFGCIVHTEAVLKHNTVIAEVSGAAPNQDVKVESEITLKIAFERGALAAAGDFLVSETLREILKEVEGVLGYFQHLITVNPHWIK